MKTYFVCAAFAAAMISACSNSPSRQIDVHSADIQTEDEIKAPPPPTQEKTKEDLTGIVQNNPRKTDITSITQSADTSFLHSGSPTNNPDWDKKIIKTANITLELKDYASYNNAIHAKLKGYGGYIAQEQQTQNDVQIQNEISIKVPVERFEDLMNTIGGEGIKIISKTISTEDVTGEVVDIKARLEAKKQVRFRYLDLLKDAKKMDDILQVQNEINSIQEDIEAANGRVNYLMHQSAFSTINLKYFQYLNGLTAKDAEPDFLSKLSEAFKNGTSVITNLFLFAIAIWPLIVCGIIVWIWIKRMNLSKVNVQK